MARKKLVLKRSGDKIWTELDGTPISLDEATRLMTGAEGISLNMNWLFIGQCSIGGAGFRRGTDGRRILFKNSFNIHIDPLNEISQKIKERATQVREAFIEQTVLWEGGEADNVSLEEKINKMPTQLLMCEVRNRLQIGFFELDMIVNAMAKRGYWCRISSPFEPGRKWYAGFTPHSCTGWNGRPDNLMRGDTGLNSVARASLLTLMNEERGQSKCQ